MNKIILLSLYFLFFSIECFCQILPNKSDIKFSTEKPTCNDSLIVTFTPGVNSALVNANKVTMQALLVPVNRTDYDIFDYSKMNEIPMQKIGNSWLGKVLPDKTTGCILFQFESDNKFDNNKNKGWDVLLYSENGQPVKGANSALSQMTDSRFISSFMDLEREDTDSALVLYKKEMALYPDNWFAKAASLNLRSKKAKKENDKTALQIIENEVDLLPDEHPRDINLLEMVYIYYYRSNPEKSARVINQIEKLEPLNSRVLVKQLLDIGKDKDLEKRMERLILLEETMWSKDYYSWYNWYYYASEALTGLEKWAPLVQLAEKTVDKIITDDSGYSYYTNKKKIQRKDSYLFVPLNSLAVTYHKLGKNDKAEGYFKQALSLELLPTQHTDILEDYLQFLVDIERWNQVVEIGQKVIEDSEYNEKIVELFKTAYSKKTGNIKTAEKIITEAKNKAGANRYNEIVKSFITDPQPAPTFKLKDEKGKNVSLTSLRGKTVIVDFWATWCGPCKESFPYLQIFYDQFKDDAKIVVLAVNSWETGEGEEKMKTANRFIKDHSYTFPVLFDIDNRVITSFGVTGIPTKYFIGPDGKIYFKEVGFHGPNMIDDMKIVIEIIKEKTRNK